MKIKIAVINIILSNLLLINSYGSDDKEVYDFNIVFENKQVNEIIVHWDAVKDAKGYFVEIREEDKMPTKTKIWKKLLEDNFPGPYEMILYNIIEENKKELKAYRKIFNQAEIVFVKDSKITIFNCKKQRYFVKIKSVSEYPLSNKDAGGFWYIDKCSKVASFIPEKISFTFFRKLKIESNLIKEITLDELANDVQKYNGTIIKIKGIFENDKGERLLMPEEYYVPICVGNNNWYINVTRNISLPAVSDYASISGAFLLGEPKALEYIEYKRLRNHAVVEVIGRVTYKDDAPLNIKERYFIKGAVVHRIPYTREKGVFKPYYMQIK